MDQQKENILNKLKTALQKSNPQPYLDLEEEVSVFPAWEGDLLSLFEKEFVKSGGHLYTADNFEDLLSQLQSLIDEHAWTEVHCKDARLLHLFKRHQLQGINLQKNMTPKAVGITSVVQLIARTGSLLLNSSQAAGRTLSIAPEIHIAIATQHQIVYSVKEALERQKEKMNPLPSLITLTTGPSRTADIEKTLVMGAHGPRALYLFLLTS